MVKRIFNKPIIQPKVIDPVDEKAEALEKAQWKFEKFRTLRKEARTIKERQEAEFWEKHYQAKIDKLTN